MWEFVVSANTVSYNTRRVKTANGRQRTALNAFLARFLSYLLSVFRENPEYSHCQTFRTVLEVPMSDHISPMLLSITTVARLIGFSRTKTYEMVQVGKIPSIIVEGRIRVTRQALDSWIAQQPRSPVRSSNFR